MKNKLWFLLLPVLLLIFAIKLVSNESEMLLRAQELNLWLPTGLYWKTLMQYPGGAASWCATYLTQYYYYPWLGTGILCGLWLIISLLLVWCYRLRGPWVALTALVPLALMACFVQTGYWIYYQKLPGHLFVPTVGVLFATLCLAVQRMLDDHLPEKAAPWVRLCWMVIVCIVGYPFFGAWALGAIGLLAAQPSRPIWPKMAVAALFIAAVPQIYYQQIFEMTERGFLYVAALPSFRYSHDSFEQYRLPYYAIILAFIILQGVSLILGKSVAQPKVSTPLSHRRGVGGEASPFYWRGVGGEAFIVLLLLFAAIFGVSKAWYRDGNFHKELAMNRAVEELDWERVLTIARDGSSDVKPTRQMVLYKNLALFRLGRAGNEMFTYPEGATPQNAPWKVRITQVGGKLIYYHYGKENFCYRWCMEDGVEFGWKAETLKFMARTSLLNHEWTVARKYLDLLKKTTFHRQWAERYEKLLDTPEAFDLETLEASAKAGKPLLDEQAMKEFAPILHMMTYPDRLDGDNTLVEMYLLQTFAKGNGDDPLFQEMTLICALIMKDIDLFWPRFMKFATMHPELHMPRHYQEAAYLYGHLEDKVDISRMPFDQEVRDSYERFMRFNEQCGPMSEEQKAVAFYPQFGGTFYYFYFLVRNQKTN
ncbi:MAG: hypothetical protein IJQ59_10285 [Bacteroidaceae bacterium]|nr:hypothetical protein [Bacteroidaceae bacterium]